MAHGRNNGTEPRQLEKLGITAIQERLEVSPIIADPSAVTADDGDGGDTKTYICTVFPADNPKLTPTDIAPLDL